MGLSDNEGALWWVHLNEAIKPLSDFVKDLPMERMGKGPVQLMAVISGAVLLAANGNWHELREIHRFMLSIMPEEFAPDAEERRKAAYLQEVLGGDRTRPKDDM